MLSTLLSQKAILLDLATPNKREALARLLTALGFTGPAGTEVLAEIEERESHGVTNVGRGVAIPHVRTGHSETLRLAYGRHSAGLDFGNGDPVHHIFLLVAPPIEIPSGYLPTLANVAKLVRPEESRAALAEAATPDEILAFLRAGGF